MTSRDPQQAMIQARRLDSQAKRARVHTTVQRMLTDDVPITFASVARAARVSTWLVYAAGVRETIVDAQTRQRHQPVAKPPGRHSTALATDLAHARAEITQLRAERADHQRQLRQALGAALDDLAKPDLVTRVEDLTRHNSELAVALAAQRHDNDQLRARVSELEDDLAAARTSLRRMIRADNLAAPP